MQIYEQHALHVYKNYYTKFFKTPCMLTLHSEHLLFPHWFRKKIKHNNWAAFKIVVARGAFKIVAASLETTS